MTTPALTPELWAELKDGIEAIEVLPTTKGGMFVAMGPRPLGKHGRRAVTIENAGEERHAIAALCLHEQWFGFTQADVRQLEEAQQLLDAHCGNGYRSYPNLASLTERIASLLPPQP